MLFGFGTVDHALGVVHATSPGVAMGPGSATLTASVFAGDGGVCDALGAPDAADGALLSGDAGLLQPEARREKHSTEERTIRIRSSLSEKRRLGS
jgi:hypothetical protein